VHGEVSVAKVLSFGQKRNRQLPAFIRQQGIYRGKDTARSLRTPVPEEQG